MLKLSTIPLEMSGVFSSRAMSSASSSSRYSFLMYSRIASFIVCSFDGYRDCGESASSGFVSHAVPASPACPAPIA